MRVVDWLNWDTKFKVIISFETIILIQWKLNYAIFPKKLPKIYVFRMQQSSNLKISFIIEIFDYFFYTVYRILCDFSKLGPLLLQ